MSQQIPSLNLTGAAIGQTGTVNWSPVNQPATLQQTQRGYRPYLELVNMSACLLSVLTHVGGKSQPLPPGSRDVYPLSQDDTSYSFTVLTNTQNASDNTVFGWYYAANEPPPQPGQTVNQSQALAAPAQTLVLSATSGAANSMTIALGPSLTGASFYIQSLTLSQALDFSGVGQHLFVSFNGLGAAGTSSWQTAIQIRTEGAYFFPLNTAAPNKVPGVTNPTVFIQTLSGNNFNPLIVATVIGSIA